jgi:glycosyltransferase involved in cell wall biosynthesis
MGSPGLRRGLVWEWCTMMRIAYVGPISLHLLQNEGVDVASTPSGFQYAFGAYLVREYLRRGHEVSVVTTIHRLPSPYSWSNDRLSIDAVPTRRGYLFCLDAFRKERRQMIAALSHRHPDVVHAQWTYEFAHAALGSGFPTLVTARDSPRQIYRHSPSTYTLYKKFYGDWLIPRLPRLTAVSPYMRQELIDCYRLQSRPVVIPNGIRPEVFATDEQVRPARPFTFTTVAGWDPRKNPKPLLAAFSELLRRHPDCRLHLIGRGFEPGGPAAKWAAARGAAAGVLFLGHQSHADVLRHLREHTDAFVHPTLEESFGSSILEAMSQRLPVIAGADSGAVPWILDAGRVGMLVDVTSPESLCSGMEKVMTDKVLRERYARDGYERALSSFTLAAVAEQYLAVLDEVASGRTTACVSYQPCPL